MDNMKRCPMCGQMVKAEALKCRYCGYWFNTPNDTKPTPDNRSDEEARRRQQEEARRQQDEARRQQDEARRRQQDKARRQQDEARRRREETRWQEENSYSSQGGRLITLMGVIQEGIGIGLKTSSPSSLPASFM